MSLFEQQDLEHERHEALAIVHSPSWPKIRHTVMLEIKKVLLEQHSTPGAHFLILTCHPREIVALYNRIHNWELQ